MAQELSLEEIETLESYLFVTTNPYHTWQGGQLPNIDKPLVTNEAEFKEQFLGEFNPKSKFCPDVREVANTYGSTLFHFEELITITKTDDLEAGAILVEVCGQEQWIPKKLCKNLDLDAKTVYVWEKFIDPIIVELADEESKDKQLTDIDTPVLTPIGLDYDDDIPF